MNLAALIALIVLSHITFVGTRVVLTLYAIHLGGSAFVAGLMVSLLSVVPMFLAVLIGRWTDRVSPIKPFAIGLTVMLAGMSVPLLRPVIESLYVCSVLLGSGFMLMHVSVTNSVGNSATAENRTRAFTILALGFSTSSIVGPVVAGFSIDLAGHVYTFAILAAFVVVAMIVLVCVRHQAAGHVPRQPPGPGARIMDLLRDRPMRSVFIVSAMLSMAWDMFTFMAPVQGTLIGLSASTIGVIMGTFAVATFAVRLAIPWMARNFGEWASLSFALGVTSFVFFLFPVFRAVPVLMALAFVLGLGLGVTQPMMLSLIHKIAPAGRTGEAVGVRTTLMNASQVMLPIGMGGLGAALGILPVFWALAAVLGCGSAYAARFKGEVGR